jgi:hypothetical protein
MRYAAFMEAQEVSIVCDQHTPRRRSERELRRIVRSDQPCFRRGRDVNVATAQAGRKAGWNVLVQMETDGHRSGWCLHLLLAQPGFNQGRMGSAKLFRLTSL